MPVKKDIVEELVKDSEKVENADIKAALEEFQKEQSSKKRKQLLGELREVERVLDKAVTELREVRQKEKRTKKMVLVINTAKEQFLVDGDHDNFVTSLLKEGIRVGY